MALFSQQPKESFSLAQIGPTFRLQGFAFPGWWVLSRSRPHHLWPLDPILEGASQEVLPSLLPRSREEEGWWRWRDAHCGAGLTQLHLFKTTTSAYGQSQPRTPTAGPSYESWWRILLITATEGERTIFHANNFWWNFLFPGGTQNRSTPFTTSQQWSFSHKAALKTMQVGYGFICYGCLSTARQGGSSCCQQSRWLHFI